MSIDPEPPDTPSGPARRDADLQYEKVRADSDRSAVTWRFHRGADRRWRWQKMRTRQLIAESHTAFLTYADCIDDAMRNGYKPILAGQLPPLGS
jgi:hypothetical protein